MIDLARCFGVLVWHLQASWMARWDYGMYRKSKIEKLITISLAFFVSCHN
jgi:hypothetical protein